MKVKQTNTGKNKDNQKMKFINTARELGCDESEAAFNAKLKKLAKPRKPKPKDKK